MFHLDSVLHYSTFPPPYDIARLVCLVHQPVAMDVLSMVASSLVSVAGRAFALLFATPLAGVGIFPALFLCSVLPFDSSSDSTSSIDVTVGHFLFVLYFDQCGH